MAYFPDALLEVAHVSYVGNEQHNPGQELHWAKEKSTDEADACVRHLMKKGQRDKDGMRHSAKAAWRALANLQREIEAEAKIAKLREAWDDWNPQHSMICASNGRWTGNGWHHSPQVCYAGGDGRTHG